ncbi:MAG: hypothetical protein ABIJ45_12085 [Candidatus Zixiibacteriota bacterium]
MKCRQAQKILNNCEWHPENYRRDPELMEHLDHCPECHNLLRAESDLKRDLDTVRQITPQKQFSLESIKSNLEQSEPSTMTVIQRLVSYRYKTPIAIAAAVVLIALVAWVPFNFQEKVGYGISISGVDKEIAMDSKGVFPLLDALGMTENKTANLKDSLEMQEIRLYVGDCTETCNLRISDLKTKKDVELVIKAIIELGCCEIDEVFPIFRDQSSSLLEHMTKKLFS